MRVIAPPCEDLLDVDEIESGDTLIPVRSNWETRERSKSGPRPRAEVSAARMEIRRRIAAKAGYRR